MKDEVEREVGELAKLRRDVAALRARHEKLLEGLRNLPRVDAVIIRKDDHLRGVVSRIPDVMVPVTYIEPLINALLEDE